MDKIIKFLFLGIMMSFYSIGTTNSFYIANQGSLNNSIQAGTWGVTISNIQAIVATPNISNIPKATITWNTNDNATGNMEWKIDQTDPWTEVEPKDTVPDATLHTREIEGLFTDTHYYFRVKSKDRAGNETISSEQSFDTGGMSIGDTSFDDIVINEFLPNPIGDDAAPMPHGEWIELYNRSDSVTYDLTGWYLTNRDPSHRLDIPTGTTIAPYGFAVVYRNGNSDFDLNNDADEIRLYNSEGNLIDQHIYDSNLGDVILENKSFARFPDGSDTWFDPIPTPGKPNQLVLLQAPAPSVDLNLSNDKKAVTFNVQNITGFTKLSYELTYFAYDVAKGVIGNDVDIVDKNEFNKGVDLATCSNNICAYDEHVHDFKLKINLEDKDGKQTTLEKSL